MSKLDITCAYLTDLVTDYMESALDPGQQLRFETHLVFCSDCQVFLGQIRNTVELLSEMPSEPIDGAERRSLLAIYDSK